MPYVPDMQPDVLQRFVAALTAMARRFVDLRSGINAGLPAIFAERWMQAMSDIWMTCLLTSSRDGVHAAIDRACWGAMRTATLTQCTR